MRLSSMPRGSRRSSGFSLIEVLVALTLLGVALLLGLQLVLENPRIVRRADAERQAFRAMEAAMESVRAGVIPLIDTPDPLSTDELKEFGPPADTPPPKEPLTISMKVDPTAQTGLYQVTLTANYTVLNAKYVKRLQTMVWSPPPPGP